MQSCDRLAPRLACPQAGSACRRHRRARVPTAAPQPPLLARSQIRRATKGRPTTVDAVTVGDAWLQRGIGEGLVQPIRDARQYRWWAALPPRWRQLVCRDAQGRPDPKGEVWAAPYRWGATLVAYRSDRLARSGVAIRDWSDLLHPQLKGRIAFVDAPRCCRCCCRCCLVVALPVA